MKFFLFFRWLLILPVLVLTNLAAAEILPIDIKHNINQSINELITQPTTHQNLANETSKNIYQNSTVSADALILNRPVLDQAGVLTANEVEYLSEQLLSIYRDNLAQIGLLLVATTDGVPIFDYTHAVAKRWGLGKEKIDNGVLIVVAVNDKEMFIATGYGLEGVLPDVVIKRIIREDITPAFKNGQYAQGLSVGIMKIDERLRTDPEILSQADAASQQENLTNPMSLAMLIIIFITFGNVIVNILGRILGSTVVAMAFAWLMVDLGFSLWIVAILVLLLWLFLLTRDEKSGLSRFYSSGIQSRGGFGSNGDFGGGYQGGGGRFGGGGAGGSW